MTDNKLDRVLERLTHDCGTVPIEAAAREAFFRDLEVAMKVRENIGGVRFADYVDPLIHGTVRSEAQFRKPNQFTPTVVSDAPYSFSFTVRPMDSKGNTPAEFYGAPTIIHKTVSLDASGILERPIGAVRVNKGFNAETDALAKLLCEVTGATFSRHQQDLFFEGLTYGKLFEAYRKEEAGSFDGVLVQPVTVLIPVNPDSYRTEAVGFAKSTEYSARNNVCFAYGVGETLYRGRPIIPGLDSRPRQLSDINPSGEEAYFAVEALSSRSDVTGETKWGNMVVVALPLVGEEPSLSRSSGDSDIFMGGSRTLGIDSIMKGGTFRGGSVDYASLSVGRATGTTSRLVSGNFDGTRPITIIDARLLTYTPETLQRTVDSLIH
ncbi:MAG: hypothetical protein AABX98_02390 [Nanoarchaeota archaeon]